MSRDNHLKFPDTDQRADRGAFIPQNQGTWHEWREAVAFAVRGAPPWRPGLRTALPEGLAVGGGSLIPLAGPALLGSGLSALGARGGSCHPCLPRPPLHSEDPGGVTGEEEVPPSTSSCSCPGEGLSKVVDAAPATGPTFLGSGRGAVYTAGCR